MWVQRCLMQETVQTSQQKALQGTVRGTAGRPAFSVSQIYNWAKVFLGYMG